MGFFTIGNLITLGIVAVALFLFRMMDKNNRSLDRVSKYVDKCKGEITAYAEEKGAAVKDFGIALEVERKSAIELMRRLQTVTEQELTEKAKAINALNERLKAYDSSLAGLTDMTGRVQENLNRIKEESGFVENIGKRIAEAREKLEQVEKSISVLGNRFEKENYEALKNVAGDVMVSVRAAVSDLETSAGAIERQVEEHRHAIDKMEQSRAASMARDMELINKTLKEAVERAGNRADKMEDAALVKLREQANERLNLLKTTWEEKLKIAQDTIRTRLTDIQEQVKTKSTETQGQLKTTQDTVRDRLADIQEQIKVNSTETQEQLKTTQDMVNVKLLGIEEQLKARSIEIQEQFRNESDEMQAQHKVESTKMGEQLRVTQEMVNAKLLGMEEQFKARSTEMQEQFKIETAKMHEQLKAKSTEIHEHLKIKLLDIQEQLKVSRESWKNECSDIETRQKTNRDEWKKSVQELDALAKQLRNDWTRINQETEQRIIAASDAALEECKAVQAEQYKQLENLANDAGQLDAELRRSMQDIINKVNGDFLRFRDESNKSRESNAAEFDSLVADLRAKLEAADQELAGIKSQAQHNVSEKIKLFEDDFYADLDKRNTAVEKQLSHWQEQFDRRIAEIAQEGEGERKEMELRWTGEQRKSIAEHSEKLAGELERLKIQAGAFEESIREQMRAADEACASFREQLASNLDEEKSSAEAGMNSRISQYNLEMAETLRQNQRELEERLGEIRSRVDGWNAAMEDAAENSRKKIQEWQSQYGVQMRDMENSMEEIRRRSRDMAAENDERITQFRNDLDDMRKDISSQERLFVQAEQRKRALEQAIEDLNGEIVRVEQCKNELKQMENQFVQIKRLEDDINSRMTRFLTEQRRIEIMEGDFKRLLQTSQAVEEKLVQVSNSDDTLQAVQVQIRRLEDSIKEAEEKYQRIEKKNDILDETTDGISRNFKALQESEIAVKKTADEIEQIYGELKTIRESIETLAAESEKARDAAGKIAVLDEALPQLEKRIAEMQVARQWLARTETELQTLDKNAQAQIRLIRSLLDREGKKAASGSSKGAPPIRERENIIRLQRQGWTVEEIANSLGYSIGEVELILEFERRDEGPKR